MTYFFSKKTNAFYPDEIKSLYGESWPEDATEVSDDDFTTYMGTPPDGKALGSTSKGRPTWIDAPAMSDEEKTSTNTLVRDSLLSDAKSKMFIPQTKLLLGNASPTDKLFLTNYIKYTEDLDAVDLLNPVWPEVPSK